MAFVYQGAKVDLGFGRGWLDKGPAASIRRIDRQIGHPLQITEAGRDWSRQNEHYQRYLKYGSPIALSPNAPSIHQKGGAIDSNEAQRIIAILEDHGWRRTVYRWVNGRWTLVEPWHFEYFAHLDNHRNDPEPTAPARRPEEDDMSIAVRLNKTHFFHIKFGGIKHLANNERVKGNHNHGPAHLTMLMVQSDDQWIELNTEEFLNQLDDWHIPRSVVRISDGFVLDVSKPGTLETPGGQFVKGGAWEWARAAYANSLAEKPVARY